MEEIVTDALVEPPSWIARPSMGRAIELGLAPDQRRHEDFDSGSPDGAVATLDGTPVIYTTLPDLTRLFGSWTQGDNRSVGHIIRVIAVPSIEASGWIAWKSTPG